MNQNDHTPTIHGHFWLLKNSAHLTVNLQSVLDACWNAHCSTLILKENVDSMIVFLIYQVKISPEEVLGDKAASRDDVDPAVCQKVSYTQRSEKGEWWIPHDHV